MSDTENKNIDFNKAKEVSSAQKAKKPHTKKSFAWWAGVIVLILISITFILPATGVTSFFVNSSIEFGKYNGTPIAYESGSYMYNQFYNLYMQYGAYMDQNSLLYQAYYNAVLNEALTQKAEAAGLYVSDEMVNKAIISSGYYNNEDGVFDENIYNETGVSQQTAVYNSAKEQIPATTVVSDISTVVSSDAEKAFVASMASTGRTFDYVAFDYTSYPDELTADYAQSNPQPFSTIQASVLSFPSQSEAETAFAEIQADMSSFSTRLEEAGNESTLLCWYELSDLAEADRDSLWSSSRGAVCGPFQNGSSYEIYRIDASASQPDLSSEALLDKVRSYINSNDASLITEYAETASQAFYEAAQADIDSAAAEYGLELHNVAFTPASNGSSAFLTALSASDSYGLLSSASYDSSYNKSLFSSAEGTVLAPQAAGNGYIVTRVNAEIKDASQADFTNTFYDYVNTSLAQNDLQNAILSSPLFEDNFYTVLIESLINQQ